MSGWRRLPSWLKGGIFGAVLLSILFFFASLNLMNCTVCYGSNYPTLASQKLCCIQVASPYAFWFNYVMKIVDYPVDILFNTLANMYIPGSEVISILVWNFIVGALIGGIYEKIKFRKKGRKR